MAILVTGATGTIGSKLLRRLAERGAQGVRAGVRSAAGGAVRGAEIERLGVDCVRLDFADPDTFPAAFAGAERVFYVVPQTPDPVALTKAFLRLAKEAGVKHVTKVSGLQCDREPTIAFGRAHRATERAIEESGVAWTFLRPNNFMDNFLTGPHAILAPDARGEIRVPWGDGACSFIAASDIANVAAHVLTDSGERHFGKAYELTGPEALTIARAAEIISSASGRALRYVDVPEDEARGALVRFMAPRVAEMVLEVHRFGREGRTAVVTSDVKDTTGDEPTTFDDFAREHASAWQTRRTDEEAAR